ncbi:restriction endonuclease subunit S [Streptomyces sp. NPDC090085]|uniref:restriction endonuclease subunit S n=1 Tax=Streptomyces sp. NPDC090085 TaxID=3365943 RepID=UPI0037F1E246
MRSDVRADWPLRRLTDLVSLPVGQVDPRTEPYRSRVLLAPDHIEPRTGKIIKRESAADQGASSGKYVVQPGDVIFSKIRPALRKVALADFSGTCSADMYPLRPGEEITSGFLVVVLLSEHFSRYVESLSGRTGIPKVNRFDLAGYFFQLPPLEEQRRIVEVVDAVSAEERAIESSIAKLKTLQAVVTESLLMQLSWGSTLREVVAGPPRNGYSPVETDAWTGVQMLALGCLTKDGFSPIQLKNAPSERLASHRTVLSDGDLLMSRANTRELVGLAGVYRDIGTPCLYPDLMMRIRPSSECSAEFLSIVLRSDRSRRAIQAMAQGTSESMVKISAGSIQNLPVPLLGFSEQRRVLDATAVFDVELEQSKIEIAKLRRLKAGVLDQLLAGRA